MSSGKLIIKRAHVFLGGPYHGAVKMVREGENTYSLPRAGLPKVAFDDVRGYFATVLYVRQAAARGDVFVCSTCGPREMQQLIEAYHEQTSQDHNPG